MFGTKESHAGNVDLPLGAFDLPHFVRKLLRSREADLYRKVCLEVDRIVLDEVMREVHGNQVLASEILGMSRTTLRGKIQVLKDASVNLLELAPR